MTRKKNTQKQKQKQSQKVIVNVGGRGAGKGKKAIHHHHHHHSINQFLTDASSTHAINNASNSLLGHLANATKTFESRDAEREANANRLSYGTNPTPAFIRGFQRPAQTTGGSGEERAAINRADAPYDNLIDARVPVARGYRRILSAEPADSSSDETEPSRRRYKSASYDPNSPKPIQVAVSKRLIEDENDLALNHLSLRNPQDMISTQPFIETLPNTEEFIQTNPMVANTALRTNTGDGALSIGISTSGRRDIHKNPYIVVNGEEMTGLTAKNRYGATAIKKSSPEVYAKIREYRNTKQQAARAEQKEDKPRLVRSHSTDASKLRPATDETQASVKEQVRLMTSKARALKEHQERMEGRKVGGGKEGMKQNVGGGGFG